jgi:hypothetical protein
MVFLVSVLLLYIVSLEVDQNYVESGSISKLRTTARTFALLYRRSLMLYRPSSLVFSSVQ